MFRYSEIAADLRLGHEGFMNQIQESLIHITQTAAERPGKSESKLVAGLVSQFTMKDGPDVSLRPIHPDDEPLAADRSSAG